MDDKEQTLKGINDNVAVVALCLIVTVVIQISSCNVQHDLNRRIDHLTNVIARIPNEGIAVEIKPEAAK